MAPAKFSPLLDAMDARKQLVYSYLQKQEYSSLFRPAHIRDATYSYINMGGKSLRPVVLLFSCGAVGGDEQKALAAAAAIEVYHTWTLVHDDVIDRDDKRRGAPTVHAEYAAKAAREWGFDQSEAAHYGQTIAILTGDLQHSWSILLLSETASKWNVDPGVVIAILADLTSRVGPTLIDGETLDVQFSRQPIEDVPESLVLDMLWKKTGVLYEFAGQTGAAIGRSDATLQDEMVRAIATFCGKCGTAFQLQDDILGIVGDASQLGKPVGSDIREGKRTTIVLKAFQEANATQRATLDQILGNPRATGDDIATATALLRNLGGIDYTRDLARKYVSDAIPHLENVPASMYKDLLMLWAAYLIEREF